MKNQKLNRIISFIPARDHIKSDQDVRSFFAALTQYLVWHPETSFLDYEHQITHKKLFSAAEAHALDECMRKSFEVCGNRPPYDAYEIAFEELAKGDKGIAAAIGRDHVTGKTLA